MRRQTLVNEAIAGDSRATSRLHGERGFSLVEVLAVIAVIGVLLAIAVPSLSRARQRSMAVASTVRASQLFSAVQSYANDYSGVAPSVHSSASRYFFTATIGWNGMLLSGNYLSSSVRSPFDPATIDVYHMSCSLLAQPEYWKAGNHLFNPQPLRTPPKLSTALFPSLKIAVIDDSAIEAFEAGRYRGPRLIAAFMDGSAQTLDRAERGTGSDIGLVYASIPGFVYPHSALDSPPDPDIDGRHTIDGVRGRDVMSR